MISSDVGSDTVPTGLAKNLRISETLVVSSICKAVRTEAS